MSRQAPAVGLVCEGPTDVRVLRAMLRELWPDARVVALQPELDEVGLPVGKKRGWTAVREWCEQNAANMDDVLDPDIGDALDLLLVVLDVDIAIQAGIEDPPVSASAYDASRLCDEVKDWLRSGAKKKLASQIVIGIAAMAVEAWVIAALGSTPANPEALSDPAEWLAARKKLRRRDDRKPWKQLPAYDGFGAMVGRKLLRVRGRCAEAERVCAKVERRRDVVERA